MAINDDLATQANLRCLKMITMDFPYPNPRDRHPNRVSSMIRTKVISLAKLPHLTIFWVAINDDLATQANLRCLKMVPMDFPCPKTWG